MTSAIISTLLIATSFPHFCFSAIFTTRDNATFSRVFKEPIRSITIENRAGMTDVRIWTEPSVSVTASRAESFGNPRIESEVSFDQSAPDTLKIVTKPESFFRPVSLIIQVPASIQLSVRGGSQRVSVRGSTASLSVETESGAVAIYLPEKANNDLSLRTIRGSIDARLPVKVFGRSDAHLLDGKLGTGGSPVIARSERGNIMVVQETGSQTASVSLDLSSNLSSAETNVSGLKSRAVSSTGTLTGREENTGASEDTIKLEARLVNLNVKVNDASGKTLPALRKDNFIVMEDDVHQEISYFEPVTAPLNIVLLLDLSGSTEKKIKLMKKAAQKFVDALQPADRIAVAAFTRRFFIISNFTTDHKLLKDRIDDIKNRHSGTAYYDAMWATLDLLEEAKTARKAIVVLTDGVDNSLSDPDSSEFDPKHSFDDLLARAEEADATIYPIYLDTEYETIGAGGRSGHDAYVTARKQLQALADQTGATMFKAERAEELEGVYLQVAAELHSLYSMAYTPKHIRKDGKWRKITVTVDLQGAKARTKRGYFAR